MSAQNVRRRKALVLLPRHFDVGAWKQRFDAGKVPDLTPYGYHHAEAMGYELVYPPPSQEDGKLGELLNRALWRTLGFDLLHVWRQREFIRRAEPDIVWTHTEHEFLGFLLLRRLGLLPEVPIVAQTVWLADMWNSIGAFRRRLAHWLLQDADVCTFHSPVNERFAQKQGWGRRTQVVEFGISLDTFPLREVAAKPAGEPVRVLAAGNDRHRDWRTLHAAFANNPAFEVRVASSEFPKELECPNIAARPHSLDELRLAYDWADVVVVPLVEQMHVSGMTVICESVALGKAVVAARTGGLDHYFTDEQIAYVPVGDAQAMAARVREIAADTSGRLARVRAAQQRFVEQDYSTVGYARRHVVLSNLLLEPRTK